jgi:hypothetical protein
MRVILLFSTLGLVALVLTIAAYPLFGQFGLPFSTSSGEWANFGTYLGGVAGPLLSFLALIAVAWTVRLQYDLLRRDLEKQTADQHVRWLEGIYRDILDLLKEPLQCAQGTDSTTTWAVLHLEVDRAITNPVILKARLDELLKLLTQYCQAVALYRANVTEFFDARIFQDRGARILDRLKPFLSILGSNAAVPIEFCDMHLRGQTEREIPEALQRRTRAF